MRRSRIIRSVWAAATGLTLAATGLALAASASAAQVAGEEPFDITRFRSNHDHWIPFHVEETVSLREAVSAGVLGEKTALLVLEIPAGRLALVEDQMTYHHAAQGRLNGEPWMVSY